MNIIPEYAKIRTDICQQCPEKNHERNTCKKCGCYIPAKALLKGISSCPLDKWPK